MDGIGESKQTLGNAVHLAFTPTMAYLKKHHPYRTIYAHGPYVGMASESDIGNSEVGHNAIGAGRVFDQGSKLVDAAIKSGQIFLDSCWKTIVAQTIAKKSTLHFIGLLSDGNVHSHEKQLHALLKHAALEKVPHIRLHLLLDGRDVGEKSAEIYVERIEELCSQLRASGTDIQIASGGGRMTTTMDRYEADWSMVERGWKAHVLGEASYAFPSLEAAVHFFRREMNLADQYFPSFVIKKENAPLGTIEDGDGVILFNFRGDRSIEISKAFTEPDFKAFDRKKHPDVFYAGLTQYDGDLKLPKNFLVHPPTINGTLGEHLAHLGVRQFACSETQKFGHVTYFWNGNRSGYFDKQKETYTEITSDNLPFDQKPWMKAFEITEATIKAMKEKSFDYGRINFPNGDMVGHTGNLAAAVNAVSCVDLMLAKLIKTSQQTGTILMITADHGNCEEMFEGPIEAFDDSVHLFFENNKKPKPKTSHTLSKVPLYIFDPKGSVFQFKEGSNGGLSNLANTSLALMGFPLRDDYDPSLLI